MIDQQSVVAVLNDDSTRAIASTRRRTFDAVTEWKHSTKVAEDSVDRT